MSKRRPKPNKVEHQMAVALDDLAEFQRFQEDVLPILRKAIAEGWSAEKILSHPKLEAMMAARQVTMAIMGRDDGRAHAAIEAALNRSKGKATERKEVSHKLETLADSELDALLNQSLKQISEDSEDGLPN